MLVAYLAGATLALALLTALVLSPQATPRALIGGLSAFATTAEGRRHALWLTALMAVGLIEANLDAGLTARLGFDLTGHVSALEGDAVAFIQTFTPHAIRQLLALHYVFVFPALLILPFALHSRSGNREATRHWLRALTALGALALPFYLFVPVLEPSVSGLSKAQPALEALRPGLTEFLRIGSAPDNCLPSLHLAAQFLLLGHAQRYGPRRLVLLVGFACVSTAWATLALGVHWALDLATALPLAWLALQTSQGHPIRK